MLRMPKILREKCADICPETEKAANRTMAPHIEFILTIVSEKILIIDFYDVLE